MVMTREAVLADAVLADAERLAQVLSQRFVPGAQPWTHAVTLWANAQPVQARASLQQAWHHSPGDPTGSRPLSPALLAVLTTAAAVWGMPPRPVADQAAGSSTISSSWRSRSAGSANTRKASTARSSSAP
jgi:hypothetical protein